MEAIETGSRLMVTHETLEIPTDRRTRFVDITARVDACVRRAGIRAGVVLVQVLHTTAGVMINENEPLLLGDLEAMLDRLAPTDTGYAHDDPVRRRVNLLPDERPNGCAHARALLLGPGKALGIVEGRLEIGRWQSIFLVELDGPRRREVSIMVLGCGGAAA